MSKGGNTPRRRNELSRTGASNRASGEVRAPARALPGVAVPDREVAT
jgi:hypothetical protein